MNIEPANPSEKHAADRKSIESNCVDPNADLSVEVVALEGLTEDDRSIWRQFRSQKPEFQSPFMSLPFLTHSQEIGRAVEIGVIREANRIVGFFPFERTTHRNAVPVSAKMNDVHGVLGADFSKTQLLSILNQCQLDSFTFHAWFGSNGGIKDFSFDEIDSFMADFPAAPNFDLYSEFLTHDRYTLKQQIRKTRKFKRDLGPVQLEFDCRNQDLLEMLFQWKRSQFQRTHTFDIFSVPWTTDLVSSLFATDRDDPVRGVLSVLFVNDVPSAMHVGIREGKLLHYWFPVYNPKFAKYSPGAEMFLRIADHCQTKEAITKIDLGYGEQPYKHKLVNKVTPCFCGLLTSSNLKFRTSRLAYRSHQMFRSMPYKDSVKSTVRKIFPEFGRRGFN